MNQLPGIFPTKIADRSLAASDGPFTPIIRLEMEFEFALDEQRLARAVDLTMDAVPILGCRFAARTIRPCWERVGQAARGVFAFTKHRREYETFKSRRIDFFSEPQIAACLYSGASTDRLILKVSHLASDAAGVKDIAAMVSSIYNRLASEPDFRPEPDLSDRRGFWQVVRHVPWYALPRIFYNYAREVVSSAMPRKSLAVPLKPSSLNTCSYVTRHIERDALAGVVRYAKAFDATINDVMLAAIFRALCRIGARDPKAAMRIGMTIDLRRYLPDGRAAAIGNFSAIEMFTLGRATKDGMTAILSRVAEKMNRRKSSWLGLSTFVSTNLSIWALPFPILKILMKKGWESVYGQAHSPDLFTNMGAIPMQNVDFGGHPARAWLLPPGCDLPMLFFGCSGYDESLSLSASVAPDPENRAVGERFLDLIVSELTGAVQRHGAVQPAKSAVGGRG